MPDFTARQRKFIKFFEGNPTEAAVKAGFKRALARSIGAEMMKNPDIIKAIQERVRPIEEADIATRESRQRFWTRVMNDTKEQMKYRLKASELLGKSQADFSDTHDVNVNVKMGLVGLLRQVEEQERLGDGRVIDVG